MQLKIILPEYIKQLLQCLEAKGCSGYLVGGCVRDALLGITPEDYDIAAPIPPEVLPGCFPGYEVLQTGARYGTVTVISDGHPVEITSFRREGAYTDSRHPDAVAYTDNLTEDLARRDFTVNAMAYRPDTGLIDPFGGQRDLQRKVLSCVGDAVERFSEDALRILRAMRFCSTLGFSADMDLMRAADLCAPLLQKISVERIFAELVKCICGQYAGTIMHQFAEPLCAVIPELTPAVNFDQKNPHHIYTVYGHIAATVDACPREKVLRLTMLLHDIAKPYVMTEDENGIRHFRGHQERSSRMAREILTRLACDRKTIEKVCRLILYHDIRPAVDRVSVHRYLLQVGYEDALLLLHVRRADLSAQASAYHFQFPLIDQTEEIIRSLQREGAPVCVQDLAVDGRDLLSSGVPFGPRMGEMLTSLLQSVADGEVKNDRQALLCRVKQLAGEIIYKEK